MSKRKKGKYIETLRSSNGCIYIYHVLLQNVTKKQQSLVISGSVAWGTQANDISALKLCLTSGSTSKESFVGGPPVVFPLRVSENLYIFYSLSSLSNICAVLYLIYSFYILSIRTLSSLTQRPSYFLIPRFNIKIVKNHHTVPVNYKHRSYKTAP